MCIWDVVYVCITYFYLLDFCVLSITQAYRNLTDNPTLFTALCGLLCIVSNTQAYRNLTDNPTLFTALCGISVHFIYSIKMLGKVYNRRNLLDWNYTIIYNFGEPFISGTNYLYISIADFSLLFILENYWFSMACLSNSHCLINVY